MIVGKFSSLDKGNIFVLILIFTSLRMGLWETRFRYPAGSAYEDFEGRIHAHIAARKNGEQP